MSENSSINNPDAETPGSAAPGEAALNVASKVSTEVTPKPSVSPSTTPPATVQPVRRDWVAPLAVILAILALAAVGFGFWETQSKLLDMQLQLARRIGTFDTSSQEARTAAKEARAATVDLLARTSALETKALDTQNQQLALSAMYQELARSNDERMLADIEQGLLLVQQQLHLAGNVRAAVLGLETLESRLAKLDKPQFIRLREAMSRDAARLRLLPTADVVGINARLDALIQSVGKLKLEADVEPQIQPLTSTKAGQNWFERLREDAWGEIMQLIHIRRLDHPDLPLLAPGQDYFLRQNLTLRLLSARLSLLQRDETTFRGDIASAAEWVSTYFIKQDPVTLSMLETLAAIKDLPVANSEIDIQESLKVLKSARSDAR